MHTFNREYSQVSSSASESKVSPSLGPLTRPVNPSEPLVLSPALQPLCHQNHSLFYHFSSIDSSFFKFLSSLFYVLCLSRLELNIIHK